LLFKKGAPEGIRTPALLKGIISFSEPKMMIEIVTGKNDKSFSKL